MYLSHPIFNAPPLDLPPDSDPRLMHPNGQHCLHDWQLADSGTIIKVCCCCTPLADYQQRIIHFN